MNKYDNILSKIKKYYKHNKLLLEMYLEDYHDNYIYIRIDYYIKLKVYRLSWIDLKLYDNNIDKIINYEYISNDIIDRLIGMLSKIKVDNKDIDSKFRVSINSDIIDDKRIIFNRYIPKNNIVLFDMINLLFEYLPKRLNIFLQELNASILGNENKYKINDSFKFDLLNDSLDDIFNKEIIKRGEEYYNEGRVFFLEKIDDTYYSVVGGNGRLYVVVIKEDKVNKEIRVKCACPCEFYCKHICAVIMAIRNNKFRKFYKITPINRDLSLLDRITNFIFILTIGIDDAGINYLVIEDDMIKILPVLDGGINKWEVLEDDKDLSLTKRLDEIIKTKGQ